MTMKPPFLLTKVKIINWPVKQKNMEFSEEY